MCGGLGPLSEIFFGHLNLNIHPWLRVTRVWISVILTADITYRKRSRIVTLPEHWSYTQTATANYKCYSKTTLFDLQTDLLRAGGHISSSTVRRRLLEAGRKAKKPLKSSFLRKKWKQKLEWVKKIWNCRKMLFSNERHFCLREAQQICQDQEGWAVQSCLLEWFSKAPLK